MKRHVILVLLCLVFLCGCPATSVSPSRVEIYRTGGKFDHVYIDFRANARTKEEIDEAIAQAERMVVDLKRAREAAEADKQ